MKTTAPWPGRAALLLAPLLALAACSKAPTPDASDPYAGGVSYPWTDQLPGSGADPYAGGRSYPWVGPGAPSGLRAAATGDGTFLSDIDWTPGTASNGWGPIEKDLSNGDKLAGDGKTLTIGGQTFAKGLGMHANGEVSYATGGTCSTFTATIGVDDAVGTRGSVVFQVWNGTTTKLYDSGIVRGPDAPRAISVPVNGVYNLRLVVRDAGDGVNYDHADWADAKLTCPPRVPAGDSFLSDLPWSGTPTNAWGPIEKDLSNGDKLAGDGKTLTIGGQTFAKGLGVHANSSVAYLLGGRCSTFTASVGLDDEVGDRGSVLFRVYGDGVELTPATLRRGTDGPQQLSVNVTGVNELKLVAGDNGDGISYDHADWGAARVSCATDADAPAGPTGLSAAVGETGAVTLDWNNNTETDLAGYRVLGGSSPDGPFQVLTPQLVTDSVWTDTNVPAGVTVYYQVVAVDTSGNASLAAAISATRPGSGGTPRVEFENLDGGPWNNRLVFNRIGSLANPPGNGVHNLVTLRVKNTGTSMLRIGSLPISGAWALDPAVTLPIDLAPGTSTDLRVRFVAEGLWPTNNSKLHEGTITLNTNDSARPSIPVELRGLWQSQSENGQEPDIYQMRRAFGYNINFKDSEPSINQKGLVRPQGEEVLSAYWQRADETQPITVRQLAAYHTQGNTSTISWHAKGSGTTSTLFTHAGIDGQSVLPRLNSSLAPIGLHSFTPSAKTFGFKVDNEWSDPARNSQTADRNNGCARPCGQHIRFFPVSDRVNQPMPNTYMVIMDYAGINYDYNDNVYVVSNIKPAPMLINVGAGGFTDPAGNVWLADKDQNGDAIYTPTTAINEPATAYTGPIAGTSNPQLYRSYRGRTSDLSVPQDQRTISFDIPVNNGTYQVKLHFAELNWNEAGRRVFDVSAEGTPRLTGLDIFAESGGRYAALVKTLDNVQVTDRKLSITLKATADFPSLSGIEVVR